MLNDFEIITRHFPENNDIKIYPISDVHLGAAEHLTAEWDNFCKRISEEPNSYVILGGICSITPLGQALQTFSTKQCDHVIRKGEWLKC